MPSIRTDQHSLIFGAIAHARLHSYGPRGVCPRSQELEHRPSTGRAWYGLFLQLPHLCVNELKVTINYWDLNINGQKMGQHVYSWQSYTCKFFYVIFF